MRSVKKLLRHLVGERLLNDEELVSFLCEAEKSLNERSLTRMGSDPRDTTPLTPNHLLLLKANDCTPNTERNHLRRRCQTIHEIANCFYKRFTSEYIPQLQQPVKWTTVKDNLKVNDIVLVADEDSPRGKWPLGIITDVELSSDGMVRAALVRVNGKEKRRPISTLVFLEHHS